MTTNQHVFTVSTRFNPCHRQPSNISQPLKWQLAGAVLFAYSPVGAPGLPLSIPVLQFNLLDW